MQEACCRPRSRPGGLHLCPFFRYVLCLNTDKNLEIKVVGVMRGLEEETGHYIQKNIQQYVDRDLYSYNQVKLCSKVTGLLPHAIPTLARCLKINSRPLK